MIDEHLNTHTDDMATSMGYIRVALSLHCQCIRYFCTIVKFHNFQILTCHENEFPKVNITIFVLTKNIILI